MQYGANGNYTIQLIWTDIVCSFQREASGTPRRPVSDIPIDDQVGVSFFPEHRV